MGLPLALRHPPRHPAESASRRSSRASGAGGFRHHRTGRGSAQLLPDDCPDQHRGRAARPVPGPGGGGGSRTVSPPAGGPGAGLGRARHGAGRGVLRGRGVSAGASPRQPSGCHAGTGGGRLDRVPRPRRPAAAITGLRRSRDRRRHHHRPGGQRRCGCERTAHPVTAMVLDRVRDRLVAGEVIWRLHYEPSSSSTQDLARAAAARGAGEGWTVVTDVQHEGRGRLGRSWVAPPETALLFSTILRPPLDVLPLLPLLAALAVAGGIEVTTGAVPDLKWPNDVLLNGKKLAGILLERPAGPDVVLGVGLNVNQSGEDEPDGGASPKVGLGQAPERGPLLAAVLHQPSNG